MATAVVEVPVSNTARGSVLALINTAVGAGVLSLPYAYRCTGWAAGLACTFLIAAVEAFTLYVLSRYAEFTGTKSYSTLVHRMLGGYASVLMCIVMVGYCWGSCIAYLIILGDSFHPLLLQAFGPAVWTNRNTIIAAIGCGCILPLCFRTRLGALRAVSSVAVYGLMVVVVIIAVRSAQIVAAPGYSWEPVRAFNPSLQFLAALPLIIFGFQCHTNVVSIFDELEDQPTFFHSSSSLTALAAVAGGDGGSSGGIEAAGSSTANGATTAVAAAAEEESKAAAPHTAQGLLTPQGAPHLRRLKSRKLMGMVKVVIAAIGVTAVFYSTVALAGYLAFPADTRSNIMLNFSATDKLIQVARATVGLIQIAAYPVNHFPARAAIRDLLHQMTGQSFSGAGFNAVETLGFFATTLAIALACDDLGLIFKLVGGTCGTILILTMPGALLCAYAIGKHRESRRLRQQHLLEPLLPAAESGTVGGSTAGPDGLAGQQQQAPPEQLPPVYSLWWSKLFWSGALLLIFSIALCVLTVATTLHPLPPP